MDGSKYFNLEVTEENTDDTENYIVDFDLGLNFHENGFMMNIKKLESMEIVRI